jgi:hypothetical protein
LTFLSIPKKSRTKYLFMLVFSKLLSDKNFVTKRLFYYFEVQKQCLTIPTNNSKSIYILLYLHCLV